MPGMWFLKNKQKTGSDKSRNVIGISQTIYGGDVLVRTTIAGVATLSAVNMPSVRPLSAADITASYLNAGTIVGILGIAPWGVVTDSKCVANAAIPSTVAKAGNQPIYNVPSMAAVLPAETSQGRAVIIYDEINSNQLTGAYLWETTAVNASLIGLQVGILLSAINGVPFYFWSTAAAVKIGIIREIPETDPYYNQVTTANVLSTTHNPRSPVFVEVFTNYNQASNVTVTPNYAT